MELCNVLAKRIKEKRIQNNLTQKELADKAQITSATISSYEKTPKNPSIEIVAKIAQAFGVSLDWLCGISDVETPKSDSCDSKKITTLKDVAEMIVNIDLNAKVSIRIRFDEYNNSDGYGISIPNTEPYKPLDNFIDGWIKFKGLYDDGTIDREVLDLWVEKELKKLDVKIDFDLKKPECDFMPMPDDDDLPF